ncbi:aspartate aminotransferase family protein [Saccharolobus solfataricus]|uniref:4-aminobutyrate aminotransferase (GabT-1) n=3 Tax=Saccharolobus solfataricus TaxID=2287 RepID=Q97VA7_SACS2|nr:aspartate aminotransferase family protein [Saccharolobus solfataricus]AAK42838.1 4-aminobutyrate aminotransferase (gabT-1) [Saccharolobus solfataricus P2]AKA72928.1 aspartate aminotransferase family protein [Saccharolobus solfataricus]AKA75627.1 aspartate aminotransferase family protein [Saccharolobus solfataricus]AKA78320.1 aspartate aminotransferase family protein [Saccharolobus solfataricus]AZF67439.1 aspartate aminotransferase family protein [Saccharolobus solfataricus]
MEENLDSSVLEAPIINVTPPGSKSLKLLKDQEEYETSAINYPKYFKIAIDKAQGSTVTDVDGNVYIDLVTGISVVNLGHNNPFVRKRVQEQLEKVWHTLEVPTEIRVNFSKKLLSTLGMRAKLLFTTTGADAVEAAVKIARFITGKKTIIAFEGSYHGITAGTLGLTGANRFKEFQPFFDDRVVKFPYPYPYRCPFKDCLNETLSLLDYAMSNPGYLGGDVAGILVEPIQGEGGYVVPPKGFLKGLKELAEKYSVPLIVDEVQTGVGRTGKMWAYQWENIEPDIVTISKAIGEGIPVSMVAYREDFDKLPTGFHLGTYRGNPLGLAAGLASLEFIESHNILSRVERLGRKALELLKEVQNPHVGDIRGLGFMIGIELVKDSKEPWSEGTKVVIERALKRGLLVYKAGRWDNVIRLMPPLTIPESLLDRAIEILKIILNTL